MKLWHRITLAIVLGLAAGASLAVYRVRGGLAAGQITNGPWATAKTYGSTDADALTRARVALSGLLALPAREAMYFTANTDSAGRPLKGRCLYSISGVPLDGRWWTVTAYDASGRLIPNTTGRYSLGSNAFGPFNPALDFDYTVRAQWSFLAGQQQPTDIIYFLPIGTPDAFELTLRVYHPGRSLMAAPDKATLPRIVNEGSCL